MKKAIRFISLAISALMTISLAGCLTTTTTSDVYYDEASTSVIAGEGYSSTNKTDKGNGGSSGGSKNNASGTTSAGDPVKHETTRKGEATLDFTPVADAGADYNVKGTVTIAVDTARPTDFDAMFDVMQKLYPNVKIKYDYWAHNQSDSALEYLTTHAATGKMADIIWDDAGCIPSYVMQGWVYPITSYVNSDPEASNIPDNLKKDYTYCNELYALPHQAHFDVTVFNTDLLNKLGLNAPGNEWTMDQYEDYLRKAAAKFNSKLCVGTQSLGDSFTRYCWWLSMNANNNGGNRYGQWGYNYNTQQVDAQYLIEGAKKYRYWRTMTTGVEAWYEQTQKASNGISQLENNLGITNYSATWSSGKALVLDANTGLTNSTGTKYKFGTKVVPTPNKGGHLSMHVDCCFITSACSKENIDAAYQLLRFMTFSTNGNLARLTMHEDSQKDKYALNSRIYYPTTTSKAVIDKFEKLSVTNDTDVYMLKNIPNSGRFDVHKLVPNMYDMFFKDVATSLNSVTDGKDDGSGMNETIAKWNKDIKATIEDMNTEIKKAQASFNKTH